MNIFGLSILRRKEYDRLIEAERKYIKITDRDEHGRFVRREKK